MEKKHIHQGKYSWREIVEFKPCAIIPVYNHVDTIERVIINVIDKLPVFVVDDGGTKDVKNRLVEICSKYENCHLIVLDKNMGKGFAVIKGFEKAFENGFSHTLQVDADGQHDLSSLDLFLKKAEENPQAVICASPIYDKSVPRYRLNGRKLTTNFVAVETLSKDIKDAMIGFRIYPLDSTLKLTNSKKLGFRMDFDIEIIVRLHWMGLSMLFLPVSVIYPEDGISNFRIFKDNVLITRVHTVLLTIMVFTFPRVIYRNIRRKRCI